MDEDKKAKVKSSEHHNDRLWDSNKPKHSLPPEGCEAVINNYVLVVKQGNDRYLYQGEYEGEMFDVVVSATTSAVVEVNRIVTAYSIKNWEPPE